MCLDIRAGMRLTNTMIHSAMPNFNPHHKMSGWMNRFKTRVMNSHYERELIVLHVSIRIYK